MVINSHFRFTSRPLPSHAFIAFVTPSLPLVGQLPGCRSRIVFRHYHIAHIVTHYAGYQFGLSLPPGCANIVITNTSAIVIVIST